MKALILCAGKGTRLRPLTYTIAKPLLPVGNKPILFHILDYVREAGIDEIGIVVSPDTLTEISAAVGDGSRWGVRIEYVIQDRPEGLAHAVMVSRDYLGDSPFLMFLGDNLIEGGVRDFVAEFDAHKPDGLILLKEVPEPRLFGVAELDTTGRVVRLVEKPQEPETNLAIVGVYLFTPGIHQAIAQISPSARGELEITDAIQKFMEMGNDVKSRILNGWWLDTGKKEDLLEANRITLAECMEYENAGQIDVRSEVIGRAEIGRDTIVKGSVIKGPASIGENCLIEDSIIGPFASIGPGTHIVQSAIEHSILLSGCNLRGVSHLTASVIGNGAEVIRQSENQATTELFVGDDSIIRL